MPLAFAVTSGRAMLLPDGVALQFALLPAGTFMMGSPEDEPGRASDEEPHQVALTRGFYLQTTEVTQAQWRALMGNNPSRFGGDGDLPVETVAWWDAVAFANALSAREGRSPAYQLSDCGGTPGTSGYGCKGVAVNGRDGKPYGTTGYRLPTEAEWEYAYRAGKATAFYDGAISNRIGKNDPNLDLIGWYILNSGSTTHPVARKQANAWGLYDMAGNVEEWCWDWYRNYPSETDTDPAGSTTGSGRVIRGGAWISLAHTARAAYRLDASPDHRGNNLGFRLVSSSP